MNQAKLNEVIEKSLSHAKDQNYTSYDVSDFLKSPFHNLSTKFTNETIKKLCVYPYQKFSRMKPDLARKIIKEKSYKYPQGQALLIRALVNLANKKNELGDIAEAEKEADWLINNRSQFSKHHAWGQPFLWYSRKVFPINIPRATVSSQVAWAMIDLFEYTENQRYLDIALDICYLFINDFNYSYDESGNICFSYTSVDNYHIHNANMLVASVLMRVYKHTQNEEIGNFAFLAANFTKSHQNDDGSFYYWAPPDKLLYKIDNYHTGFVLESFNTIAQDCETEGYSQTYQRGIEYYKNNLFEGSVPKMTNVNKYPIDIQSCAQSIITFSMDRHDINYKKMAGEIAEYAINNFFIESRNHFAYRLERNGRLDKSYYFRWGDAWMLRALSFLVDDENERK